MRERNRRHKVAMVGRVSTLLIAFAVARLACAPVLLAQEPAAIRAGADDWGPPADRLWTSFQVNVIQQWHGPFDANYSGPNSLQPQREQAASLVATLFAGYRATKRLEVLCDLESVGGTGLSGARGLGGVTNVDAPRDESLSASPYVARAMLHYTLPLGGESVLDTRNPLSLASRVAGRRLEIRIGKMSAVDFFDLNSVGSDSHLQFANFGLVNNGTYIYAADARGYGFGALAEYDDKSWAVRFAEMLVPSASGAGPDWDVAHSGGESLEIEARPTLLARPSVVRLLMFATRADVASYQDAIAGYLAGADAQPTTVPYRRPGTTTVGVGVNAEHQLAASWRVAWRVAANDGASEATAIDRTFQVATDVGGDAWHRAADKVGLALVVNTLSSAHARYLQLGGLGNGLGDGTLRYGAERILETYYTSRLFWGLSAGFDYQFITRPGYNHDRGPVSVLGVRIHLERALPLGRLLSTTDRVDR